jgi:hypothetical protein
MTPVAQVLDAPNLAWTSSGDASWYGQSETVHDGIRAARSGLIGDNQKSFVQTIVNGPGSVTFWWKVSSEEWFDYLTFAIDGARQAAISGEIDWRREIFPVIAGPHVLSWTYSKDASDSAGQDAAWLEDVEFGSGPPLITKQPLGQSIAAGKSIRLTVGVSGAPPMMYQWLKDGTNLSDATLASVDIQNATRADSGFYSVIASNSLGMAASTSAVVRVLVPLSFSRPQFMPDGTLAMIAGFSDGAQLESSDLPNVEAEVSTNLVEWESLSQPLTLTNGTVLLVVPQWWQSGNRFYRILSR